jgi:DNA polymerase-3 subunit delta
MAQTGVSYEQLETAFRHRNFRPLYFLYGEERFLMDTLQALLLEHALEPHERDFNLDLVYGAETDARQVLALCASYPLMAPRRVVVVRDFDKLKENIRFKEYAERPNPQAVVLLIAAGKPNGTAHPYRALREKAVWTECKPLTEKQRPGWIQRRVQQQGYRIEADAVQMLADYVGTSLQAAATEIDKLMAYVGERTTLRAEDVLKASGQTREINVFELQKAIGEGRQADALRITERMLQHAANSRSESLMVVSVLTSYFTKLWKLAACQSRHLPEREMAEYAGVSPYFLQEYLQGLRRFGPPALEQAFAALLAADYELKGGSRRSDPLILDLMLRRMMALRTPAAGVAYPARA